MESPLEVLSRAATMVQDNANDSRLTTKELPTAKWRRDRRLRNTEYHQSISTSPSSSPPTINVGHIKPLTESTNTTVNTIECPIDMTVTSTSIKPRSPPPPYREPLPGSTFASTLARPSVITQAPPKREGRCISNLENDNHVAAESISMCDPVIDEHFRRSLGADYMVLFSKTSNGKKDITNSARTVTVTCTDTVGTSVDDHFAKALGDTWKKLQANKK